MLAFRSLSSPASMEALVTGPWTSAAPSAISLARAYTVRLAESTLMPLLTACISLVTSDTAADVGDGVLSTAINPLLSEPSEPMTELVRMIPGRAVGTFR